MPTKTPAKKKPVAKAKVRAKIEKPASKPKRTQIVVPEKTISMTVSPLAAKPKETAKEREDRERRRQVLHQMLMRKRQEIIKEIEGSLGQSLIEDKQRRLESARDVGDQALMDLDRELGARHKSSGGRLAARAIACGRRHRNRAHAFRRGGRIHHEPPRGRRGRRPYARRHELRRAGK